jgi:hypothetical protein
VVRRHAGDHVRYIVVIGEPIAGPEPPRRRRSRPRAVAPGPPAPPGPVTRVTVVFGDPVSDPRGWLAAGEQRVEEAVDVLWRIVAAHRVAAADPYIADPDVLRALAARIGYGSGQQVADGDWAAARELPPPRNARRGPCGEERLAALLAGRDVALACEELALRARADVTAGRAREAALQLEAALESALAELEGWRDQRDLAERLAELAALREPVAAAAAAARAGTLDPAQAEAVAGALGRLEAALRARAVAAAE